jgi:hypothetical protein
MQTNDKQKHTKQLQQWGSTSLLSHHLRATCEPDAKRCVEQKGEKTDPTERCGNSAHRKVKCMASQQSDEVCLF